MAEGRRSTTPAGAYRKGDLPMGKTLRPGTPADRSGIYRINGPRGGNTGQERTVARGEPMPPTPKPGETYTLVRPAHNG
ncbi:MAG: hypothetical protein ACREMY_32315, partial [bacterium]